MATGHAQPPGVRDSGVSRDRFVVLTSDGIYVHDASTGWRPSRVIQPPPGATFEKLALGDRWLVTRASDRLYVYDLDAARLVTTLPSQVGHDNEFATWFAVGDTTIAATGTVDQVWTFDGTTWHPAGLLVGANDKSPPIYRETKIGDVVWIGNPRMGDGRDGGTIHGFRLTRYTSDSRRSANARDR